MFSVALPSNKSGHGDWRVISKGPLQEGSSRAYRYVDQFTKLNLWGMTMYHTLVYLDADTMVMRSLSHLLNSNLGNHSIGVSAQTWYGNFEAFNMGVFVIHPERHEYERLLKLQ